MATFYHTALASEVKRIQNEGLAPSDADECECGLGVHVTETEFEAELWASRFEHEIIMTGKDVKPVFAIFKVNIDESEYTIWEDYYKGEALQDVNSLVLCTEENISPSRIELVKDESTSEKT